MRKYKNRTFAIAALAMVTTSFSTALQADENVVFSNAPSAPTHLDEIQQCVQRAVVDFFKQQTIDQYGLIEEKRRAIRSAIEDRKKTLRDISVRSYIQRMGVQAEIRRLETSLPLLNLLADNNTASSIEPSDIQVHYWGKTDNDNASFSKEFDAFVVFNKTVSLMYRENEKYIFAPVTMFTVSVASDSSAKYSTLSFPILQDNKNITAINASGEVKVTSLRSLHPNEKKSAISYGSTLTRESWEPDGMTLESLRPDNSKSNKPDMNLDRQFIRFNFETGMCLVANTL